MGKNKCSNEISRKIGEYIKNRGFNLKEVSRITGINYRALYDSLYNDNKARDLRAEELIPLCIFLDVDPRIFADDKILPTKN